MMTDVETPPNEDGNEETPHAKANPPAATPGEDEALDRDGDSPGAAAAGTARNAPLVLVLLLVGLVGWAGLITFAVLFAKQDKNITLITLSRSSSPSMSPSMSPTTTKNTTLSPIMSPISSPSPSPSTALSFSPTTTTPALSFSPTTTTPIPFPNEAELLSAVYCFVTSDGNPNPVKWNSAGQSGCTGLSSCGTGTNLSCSEVYGQEMNDWDVNVVTDFRNLFYGMSLFNEDISNWDVSSGEDFGQMFSYATSFNGDVSSWDVSRGQNFAYMFYGATSFNGDVSSWDVSSGRSFTAMFYEATSFDQDLSRWCIPSGTAMFFNSGMSSCFGSGDCPKLQSHGECTP